MMIDKYALPIQRACEYSGVNRSAWYQERSKDRVNKDSEIIEVLNKLMGQWPRWGFWKCYRWMRHQGYPWNHKRIWRVYGAMKLNLPRRKKKALPKREKQPLMVLPQANHSWALDFMHDTLVNGRRFRVLNIMDEGVRECLNIEADTSLSAARVVRALERIKSWRQLPQQIRMDNGPELTSSLLADWCKANDITMVHIQPGKPNQNAYIERFNRTFRYEVLNSYLFESLAQVREIAWQWMLDYNQQRPHDSLGGLTPTAFRLRTNVENSSFKMST